MRDLMGQHFEAQKYALIIQEAFKTFNISKHIMVGLISRESAWGRSLKPRGPGGTGDFEPRKNKYAVDGFPPDGLGWGRGLCQHDYRWSKFAREGDWRDPRANIMEATKLLFNNRRLIAAKLDINGDELIRGMLASYNAGPDDVFKAYRNKLDIDFYTTGKDYSRDVFKRAEFFREQGWI
jgi:hypothetical protein